MNPIADQHRSEKVKNELWINSIIKIRITEINSREMFKGMKETLLERP